MQAEVVGQPEAAHLSGISARALRDAVTKMPDSPRKGPDAYYRGLLALFDMLDASPINVLSDRMGVPKQTIRHSFRRSASGTARRPDPNVDGPRGP